MAKRLLLVAKVRLSLVVMAITIFAVDIVAFQPLALVDRISSALFVPDKPTAQYRHYLTAVGVSKSNLPLKSVDNDDGHQDILFVENKQDDSIQSSSDDKVDELLALLDSVPSNLPTSRSLTDRILNAVKNLEEDCPTSEDLVLSKITGNWELLWTAQDQSSEQYINGGLRNRFINPLENQSYSNNPFRGDASRGDDQAGGGRANPVLPREIQDALERTGVLESPGGTKLAPIRSSQGIDNQRKRVRNVVNVQFKKPFPVKGSLIVDVNFKPNSQDKRRIDVKFDSCRLIFQNAKVDQTFPLGIFGPRGWLRTGYVDDRIRITRGHKGSVFILSRTAKKKAV